MREQRRHVLLLRKVVFVVFVYVEDSFSSFRRQMTKFQLNPEHMELFPIFIQECSKYTFYMTSMVLVVSEVEDRGSQTHIQDIVGTQRASDSTGRPETCQCFTRHFFADYISNLKVHHSFFFLPFLPQHFRKQNRQVPMKRSVMSRTTVRRKARTSRLWYWYQVSSWAWTLKCSAPLFLMVNSIQNKASSRALMGLSWWILDSRITLSLYLDEHGGVNAHFIVLSLHSFFQWEWFDILKKL